MFAGRASMGVLAVHACSEENQGGNSLFVENDNEPSIRNQSEKAALNSDAYRLRFVVPNKYVTCAQQRAHAESPGHRGLRTNPEPRQTPFSAGSDQNLDRGGPRPAAHPALQSPTR